MESFLPLGGFQLPFQKRLSRLYNDTKKSSDFVQEPVQYEGPEMKALHRKLRIQIDRLETWGVMWSDSTKSAEIDEIIDESLSKAGLSELVGSIMSTIKDILAEVQPLWLSSKRIVQSTAHSPDMKLPLVQWDKGRYQSLVHDLTASIDTLFDLSRARSSAVSHRPSKALFKTTSSSEDVRPYESSRIQTPQEIDPETLTFLQPLEGTSSSSLRQVVYMSKTAYSELVQGTSRHPWAPLLLEYATFDPIYSATGIMPPMDRFEKLSSGLQQDSQRSPGTWSGLPRLLGYFEDMQNSRLGLVYMFPPSFNPVPTERLTSNPTYNLSTLRDLLSRPNSEPRLEAKFKLAQNLVNTVFDMHSRGVTHGALATKVVSFCNATKTEQGAVKGEPNIRQPLACSFDLFPDASPGPKPSLFRHPLDPRNTPSSPLAQNKDQRVLDLYSLAMVLLSIGLWTQLEDLVADPVCTFVPEALLETLAIRCGTPYMTAVQTCWAAVDTQLSGRCTGEELLSNVQVRASGALEACCILDGVSVLHERLDQELTPSNSASTGATASIPTKHDKASKEFKEPIQDPSRGSSYEKKSKPFSEKQPVEVVRKPVPRKEVKPSEPEADAGVANAMTEKLFKREKTRLYPHVPLSPEVVDRWNKIVMPQVNHALRHFYRKHPESVEMSLESIGPSPEKTQPTVLVICQSVGKVRAILHKRLGDLFDDTNGYGLKVCRGQVLRSRRHPSSVPKPMARRSQDDNQTDPNNPEYQPQPHNGASIGCWVKDRHLPPVSLGGIVVIDDRAYGMTVHHMLDDPDKDVGATDTSRCSGLPRFTFYDEPAAESSVDDFAYDLSDSESEAYSDSDITSDYEDDEDEDEGDFIEPGDIPGVEPGFGDGYIVTQPALDDVKEGFFPDAATEDEDHIDSFRLGEIFASSGIRRKEANGLIHEVDWALFEFAEGRQPDDNSIPRAQEPTSLRKLGRRKAKAASLRPTTVAPSTSLPGMEVQCMARTSGLQTGQILPALTSVKIYGRSSPSHTYQVTSVPPAQDGNTSGVPLGIPGDSGAWVIDRRHGQLCGHVLAWSQRKHVAYICPMDVLLLDIAETLEAYDIRLPGGESVITLGDQESHQSSSDKRGTRYDEDLGDLLEEEPDLPPRLITELGENEHDGAGGSSEQDSSSPIRMDMSTELAGLTSRFDEVSMGGKFRIGVGG